MTASIALHKTKLEVKIGSMGERNSASGVSFEPVEVEDDPLQILLTWSTPTREQVRDVLADWVGIDPEGSIKWQRETPEDSEVRGLIERLTQAAVFHLGMGGEPLLEEQALELVEKIEKEGGHG